jgi:flagellar M-ring protein FliF
VREQKKPSASVVLTLMRGRSIDEGQVSAIVHMVSSSVPELDPKSVTVVDQRGNLLSAANAAHRGLDVSQLKYAQEIEQGYIRRIETILQPILGTATCARRLRPTSTSRWSSTPTRSTAQPGPGAGRHAQPAVERIGQNGGTPPGGVPGALSNQPPVNPSAPIVGPRRPTHRAPASGNARRRRTGRPARQAPRPQPLRPRPRARAAPARTRRPTTSSTAPSATCSKPPAA